MKRPNILYLHSHDTGRYIQPYGHAIPTPNLQRLAEQGILFRQAFCGGPTCSPSRAALLTGQSPHSSGMIGLAHRGFSLNDYSQTIIHALRSVGYYAALVGAQHIAQDPKVIGYDEIVPDVGRTAPERGEAAARWLTSSPKQPFFLDVGCNDTHRPFREPGPTEDPRYCMPPAPIADTPETRWDMACYKAEARVLDQGFGKVLDALDAADLAADTLVICTTDHGISFPGMKCNLTDHGIGVFLIMRGPGGFTGGKVCDAMVSQIDLFPTVCDLLEIEPPGWLQGKSIMPIIRGEVAEVNDEIFSEVTYHAAYEPMRCVRTRRWKYIRRFDGRVRPVLSNCNDNVSKKLWLEHGWQDRAPAAEQLYDLVFDPQEANNIATDPQLSAVLQDMRNRLERWMRETDDPLLRGPVPAPPGAKVNDPDGLSPNDPVRDAR